MPVTDKELARLRRHKRVRTRVSGTLDRPRLCVFRSNRHMYAQVVDDVGGRTLVSASTLDPNVRADLAEGAKVDAAGKVGEAIAKKALEKGIESVVFDRGGFLYHGRVRMVAESARKAGLKF